jgi:arylsulfatase A-like enzyme
MLLVVFLPAYGRGSSAAAKPNIVAIVADDLGWGHIGWQNPVVRTPHLDRLAAEGIRLNQHYVAPVCSPTRVAFMTGRYWSRFGCNKPLGSLSTDPARAMPAGTPTLAEALRTAGYRTAMVGKWHLGAQPEAGPERFGFDYFYGIRVGGCTPLTHKWLGTGPSVLWRGGQIVEEEGHVTDLFAREAVQWLGAGDGRPFFLYLAFTSPHVPLQEPARWTGLYDNTTPDPGRRLYWAAISHLDDAVGQVIAAVDRTGQRENTIFLFFSDNGSPGSLNRMQVAEDAPNREAYPDVMLPGDNLPFRGKKGDVFEGGIRVPAFFCWPAGLKAGVSDSPVHVSDWMPTLCRLVGYRPPRDLHWDGRNIMPLLDGSVSDDGTRALYFKAMRAAALREGPWKLIVAGGRNELYNLATDIGETTNLADQKQDIVGRLRTLQEAEAARDDDALPPPGQRPR